MIRASIDGISGCLGTSNDTFMETEIRKILSRGIITLGSLLLMIVLNFYFNSLNGDKAKSEKPPAFNEQTSTDAKNGTAHHLPDFSSASTDDTVKMVRSGVVIR